MKKLLSTNILILLLCVNCFGQLKFLVEDFEGLVESQSNFKKEGIFSFGSAKPVVESSKVTGSGYSGSKAIRVNWNGKDKFGGWGIGLGRMVDLIVEEDYLNFYIYSPALNKKETNLRVSIEEDDNHNGKFDTYHDDVWSHDFKASPKDEWQLISLPLKGFFHDSKGGDKKFNTGYKEGKIFSILFTFRDSSQLNQGQHWYFDFISFSKGPIPTGKTLLSPPPASANDYALLGAWSEEGNSGNFNKIASTFEGYFKPHQKKLGVVHFFQPFASGEDMHSKHYPSVSHINDVIAQGYVPMITLENHYVQVNKNYKQPNLYSIIEGHYDFLFYEWAERIKQANGTVLLRILHEFNGDWYPWCLSKNENQPWLYVEAYKRIANFFKHHNVNNVKFVWCPNSMSIPQESWNYIMDAYPGDDYVDYVGLDVYNGAGEQGIPIWRSFRKEAIENYYLLTTKLPNKPLIICETASRERMPQETGTMQGKDEWIAQMADALQTDLSKIRLIIWFNEYKNFKINSSESAKKSFSKNVWQNSFFKAGDFDFLNHWIEFTNY
jgi:beta-mannanase